MVQINPCRIYAFFVLSKSSFDKVVGIGYLNTKEGMASSDVRLQEQNFKFPLVQFTLD